MSEVALLNPSRDLDTAAEMIRRVEVRAAELEEQIIGSPLKHEDYLKKQASAKELRQMSDQLRELHKLRAME